MTDLLPLALVLLAVLGLVAAWWVPHLRTRRLRGQEAGELGGAAGRAGRDGGRVLIGYTSPHCARCRPVHEALAEAARRGQRVIEVDISRDSGARAAGVQVVPTVLVVEAGRVARVLTGPDAEKCLADCLAGGAEGRDGR